MTYQARRATLLRKLLACVCNDSKKEKSFTHLPPLSHTVEKMKIQIMFLEYLEMSHRVHHAKVKNFQNKPHPDLETCKENQA